MDKIQITHLSMDEIFSDEDFNCRGPISPMEVMDLAKSIKEVGLLQPVVVEPWTDPVRPNIKYLLLAGYRRFKACQINQAKEVPCVIKEQLSEIDRLTLNLTENLQRKDLNIIQEAHSVERMSRMGLKNLDIARKLAKSTGWVQNRFYLLELPEEIQKLAASGIITQAQIRELALLPNQEKQFEAVRVIKDRMLWKEKYSPEREKEIQKKRAMSKVRTKEEMFELQELIQENTKDSDFGAKILAWCTGVIDSYEVHAALARYAKENYGTEYEVPVGLLQIHNGTEQVKEEVAPF